MECSLYNEHTEFKNKMIELEISITYDQWKGDAIFFGYCRFKGDKNTFKWLV